MKLKKMKRFHKILLYLMLVFLVFVLVNLSGRYMGIKETQKFLESGYHKVLQASDICFENDYIYFVDIKNQRAGCTPSIPFQNGTWYIKLS